MNKPAIDLATVGVVIIGRNEGPRLKACFESICGATAPLVYVDSGSTDKSVAIAKNSGIEVVELAQRGLQLLPSGERTFGLS